MHALERAARDFLLGAFGPEARFVSIVEHLGKYTIWFRPSPWADLRERAEISPMTLTRFWPGREI